MSSEPYRKIRAEDSVRRGDRAYRPGPIDRSRRAYCPQGNSRRPPKKHQINLKYREYQRGNTREYPQTAAGNAVGIPQKNAGRDDKKEASPRGSVAIQRSAGMDGFEPCRSKSAVPDVYRGRTRHAALSAQGIDAQRRDGTHHDQRKLSGVDAG